MNCPCGLGLPYAECCGPAHAGAPPATAEALMRSRYSAFALELPDYLLDTWHPSTRPPSLDLDPGTRWTGLRVLSARGGMFDTEGEVVFRATWEGGSMRERSRFVREEGRWLYVGAL
jgi:SEC-C motif domain protein